MQLCNGENARQQAAESLHDESAYQIRPYLATASVMERYFSMNGSMLCSVLSSSCAFFRTSAAWALGITATPSSSAVTMSPGDTTTPAHVTGTFIPARR